MSQRRIAATLAGVIAGAVAFTILMLAAILLYRRVWGESPPALAGLALVFGAAGAYAGWLLGLIVFSAIRGAGREADGEG